MMQFKFRFFYISLISMALKEKPVYMFYVSIYMRGKSVQGVTYPPEMEPYLNESLLPYDLISY